MFYIGPEIVIALLYHNNNKASPTATLTNSKNRTKQISSAEPYKVVMDKCPILNGKGVRASRSMIVSLIEICSRALAK